MIAIVKIVRLQLGGRLQFGKAVFVIFREPQRHALVVMGWRVIAVELNCFVEVG